MKEGRSFFVEVILVVISQWLSSEKHGHTLVISKFRQEMREELLVMWRIVGADVSK